MRHAGSIVAVPALLALAACGKWGGGDDFTVELKGSPAAASAVLSAARVDGLKLFLPGITAAMSRPSDHEVLYTIPVKNHAEGKTGQSATIRFRIEPGATAGTTLVHVAADVPPIRVLMGQANMVLSEEKVEAELSKILNRLAQNPLAGQSSRDRAEPLGELLAGVAIAGNSDLQAMANQAKRDPQAFSSLFGEGLADNGALRDVPARDTRSDPDTVGYPADPPPEPEAFDHEVPVE
jgi:hypothetical protein